MGGWSTGDGAQRAGRDARAAGRPDGRGADPAQRPAGADRRLRRTCPARLADLLRELGFRSSVGAPIKLGGRLWGAVMVSTVEEEPFPPGRSSGSRTSRSSSRWRWPTPRRARSWPPRAPGSSRPATPSGGGSSATCTTARSSGSWRFARPADVRAQARRRRSGRRGDCSCAPRQSSPTRWRSCASWRAGSIPRSSPTTASSPRSRCSPIARASRSRSPRRWTSGCRRRSRPPPTTSSPRR